MAELSANFWTEHDGKSWPKCPPHELVSCERRNGWEITDLAAHILWLDKGGQLDVIRYRKATI